MENEAPAKWQKKRMQQQTKIHPPKMLFWYFFFQRNIISFFFRIYSVCLFPSPENSYEQFRCLAQTHSVLMYRMIVLKISLRRVHRARTLLVFISLSFRCEWIWNE